MDMQPATLVGTVKNPVPHGAVVGYLTTHDGLRLRFARWKSSVAKRQGTICLLGGRSEYIEKYFETVADLTRRGFSVATFDWRGQGGSDRLLRDRRKGHVNDFAEYDRDLLQFVREVLLPDCPPPYFALAHSMGANVALRAARARDCFFERMVLTAPMVGIARLPMSPSMTLGVAETAVYLGLGDSVVPSTGYADLDISKYEGNPLTSDPERFARNREILINAPHLRIGSPTIGWLRAALESMSMMGEETFPPSVTVPALMIAASNDRIVSNGAIEALSLQMRTGVHLTARGSEHEVLQEREGVREQFWAAFEAFIPGHEA